MSFYEHRFFPALNDLLTKSFRKHRAKLLLDATGTVLEIGFGSGLSLEHYPASVTRIIAVEPNAGMREKAGPRVLDLMRRGSTAQVELLDASAERLPIEDRSVDAVLSVLTLCSVSDLGKSLSEIHRVLKPGGKLLFIEHMAQPKPGVTRKLQGLLSPTWQKLALGCHLDRDTLSDMRRAGFETPELKILGYSGFPNILSPIYRGRAHR